MTWTHPTPLLVIAGPTASGKSGLGIDLARLLGGEVINGDSVQVYRGLDIGSAKVLAEEAEGVPHHLVDIREPHEPYTAGDFVRDADRVIAEVAGRGRLPVVVGGSGLYLRSLLRGLSRELPACEEVRERLRQEAGVMPDGALHARLRAEDPKAAERIHANDEVRIVRALEVIALTGRRMSELQAEHGLEERRYPALVLLLAVERGELHARIGARSLRMVEDGLLAEVEGLLARGVPATAPPLASIGYRHALEALATGESAASLAERIARDTRRFARRQRTFFRRQIEGRWVRGPVGAEEAGRLAEWVVGALASADPAEALAGLRPGHGSESEALGAV